MCGEERRVSEKKGGLGWGLTISFQAISDVRILVLCCGQHPEGTTGFPEERGGPKPNKVDLNCQPHWDINQCKSV